MNTVLVTAIGSFAADIVIKNLKKQKYKVIGCDIYNKEWVVDAYNVDEFFQVPKVSEEVAYLKFILDICQTKSVDFIFPLTDIEVDFYNKHREEFEDKGVCLCISEKKAIDICRNKKVLNQYLQENNVCRVIPTYTVNDLNIEALEYPVVAKPYNGRSSQGLSYIDTKEQMQNFLSRKDVIDYIIQPKIEGAILTVDVVRDANSEQIICIARRELLRTLNGAGTSVYVFEDQELEMQCVKIAELLNVKGCVNFEFIETNAKEKYFLECNPRFSGGVEFSCLTGYDCIANHIRCFSGEKIEKRDAIRNQYIARKYEEYVTKVEGVDK